MTFVKPIPEGYNTITISIVVSDVGKAIEFYKEAFGATGRVPANCRQNFNRPR